MHFTKCSAAGSRPTPNRSMASAGASVLEIVEDFDGDTWRAVYTVELAGVIYVLDFFQKMAKKGIRTPKHIIDRIKKRRRDATVVESQKRQ
jgi:phage-related protein